MHTLLYRKSPLKEDNLSTKVKTQLVSKVSFIKRFHGIHIFAINQSSELFLRPYFLLGDVCSERPHHLEVMMKPLQCLGPTEAVVVEMHFRSASLAGHASPEAADHPSPLKEQGTE